MKVSLMHPIIASDNPEKTMEFYKALGFTTIKHATSTIGRDDVYVIASGDVEMEIMKAPKTSLGGPLPAGLYGLKMNVDDIDDAVETIKKNGGTINGGPFENEWTKVYLATDAEGINIVIVKHIKK